MSDDNDKMRLSEADGSLAGDALIHAVRRDMQGLFGLVKGLDQKVEALDQKVEALDQKVEARLHDTRPMWEAVVSRLDGMERRLDAIEVKLERFDAIDTELRHLRRRIERTIGQLSKDVVEYRVDQHDLEDRLEKLEKTPA